MLPGEFVESAGGRACVRAVAGKCHTERENRGREETGIN